MEIFVRINGTDQPQVYATAPCTVGVANGETHQMVELIPRVVSAVNFRKIKARVARANRVNPAYSADWIYRNELNVGEMREPVPKTWI